LYVLEKEKKRSDARQRNGIVESSIARVAFNRKTKACRIFTRRKIDRDDDFIFFVKKSIILFFNKV